jgi:hypothetical protein
MTTETIPEVPETASRAAQKLTRVTHELGEELKRPVTISGATVAAVALVAAAMLTGVGEAALAGAGAYLAYRARKSPVSS